MPPIGSSLRRAAVLTALIAPALLALAQPGRAAFTTNAVGNATVQPAGPRTGTSGLRFLNIEGSANNAFASYGVIDFQTPAGTSLTSADTLTLDLTEDNSSFTKAGDLAFYLTTDTATSILAGASPLVFDATALPTGLGSQLATLYPLGTGTFNSTGSAGDGTLDTYTFALSGAAQTYLTSQVNANGAIRLVVAPNDATVAATWVGHTNTAYPVPKLTVGEGAVIPEPSALALLLTGGLPLVLRRRR